MKLLELSQEETPEVGDLVRIRTRAEVKELYEDVYYKLRIDPMELYKRENDIEIVPDCYRLLYDFKCSSVSHYRICWEFGSDEERKYSNEFGVVKSTDNFRFTVGLSGNKTMGRRILGMTREFLEVVEKDYIGKQQRRKEEKKKMRTETTDYSGVVEEMISKVDKRKMKRILSASLQLSANVISGIDKLLLEWAEAKKDIYLLFDRKFEISTENEFEVGTDEKYQLFKEIVQKQFPAEYRFMDGGFSFEKEVFPNVVNGCSSGFRYLKEFMPNITDGMRFTQLMHETFKNPKFDIALSKFLNMTKVMGCITISIDPIEYMLMSLNDSGWTSCHTLHDPAKGKISFGCYSAGIFSYMCDDVSVIAFRHKSEESIINVNNTKIKAYSKNWRQMVYLDLDNKAFICSRQYPSNNIVSEKIVREVLEELLAKKFNLEHTWKKISDKYAVQEYIFNAFSPDGNDCSLHYNDILHDYDGKLIYNKALNNKNDIKITIGSFPTCPICGKHKLDEAEYPMCCYCYEQFSNENDEDD